MMGSEIALVFALAGQEVRLSDTEEERLNTAMANLAKVLERGAARAYGRRKKLLRRLPAFARRLILPTMPTATW